jgi:hypothetical protein
MTVADRFADQAASTRFCGDNPPAVERVLSAARRIHPAHGLDVTFAPEREGPPWEFHPIKRWLVLRTEQQGRLLEAVTCTMLARSAWLGQGPVAVVPDSLRPRYLQTLGALLAALEETPPATTSDAQAHSRNDGQTASPGGGVQIR